MHSVGVPPQDLSPQDLSKRKLEVMQYALSRMYSKDGVIKKKNLIQYIYLEANNNIVAVTSTGRYFRFHTEDEFDQHIKKTMDCKEDGKSEKVKVKKENVREQREEEVF